MIKLSANVFQSSKPSSTLTPLIETTNSELFEKLDEKDKKFDDLLLMLDRKFEEVLSNLDKKFKLLMESIDNFRTPLAGASNKRIDDLGTKCDHNFIKVNDHYKTLIR